MRACNLGLRTFKVGLRKVAPGVPADPQKSKSQDRLPASTLPSFNLGQLPNTPFVPNRSAEAAIDHGQPFRLSSARAAVRPMGLGWCRHARPQREALELRFPAVERLCSLWNQCKSAQHLLST